MILLIFGADALCCCLGCCCSLARGTQTSITIIHELKQQLRERFCTRHVSATFITSIIVYQHYLLIDSCLNLRNINRPQEYSYIEKCPHTFRVASKQKRPMRIPYLPCTGRFSPESARRMKPTIEMALHSTFDFDITHTPDIK